MNPYRDFKKVTATGETELVESWKAGMRLKGISVYVGSSSDATVSAGTTSGGTDVFTSTVCKGSNITYVSINEDSWVNDLSIYITTDVQPIWVFLNYEEI
jgi:hypothetical protein